MNNDLTSEQWMVLFNCIRWAKGVLFQGNRLLETSEASNKAFRSTFDGSEDSYEKREHLNYLGDLCKLEEEFFVFALDRAIFSLKEASKLYPEFKSCLEDIETTLGAGHVKDIRDMRTHIDKYAVGKGNVQERFVYKSEGDALPFAETLFAADATSTIVFNDAYLIGGRINVQKALEVMNKNIPAIKGICNKYSYPSMDT